MNLISPELPRLEAAKPPGEFHYGCSEPDDLQALPSSLTARYWSIVGATLNFDFSNRLQGWKR